MAKKSKKKDDKPYMPFYIGDWFKAPEVRALPHANRMIWFEILCIMWQSEEKGYLTINGKPFVITDDITGEITHGDQLLGNMLGSVSALLQESFRLFKQLGVYKVREDGAIYSGFMVELVKKQQVKSKAGKAGMEARYSKSVITPVITPFEYENVIIKEVETNIFTVSTGLELPTATLEAVERNQFSLTQSRNTDFILDNWGTFLMERLAEPEQYRNAKYPDLNSLTTYFTNWMRHKRPPKHPKSNGVTPYEQQVREQVLKYKEQNS